jgi:hypothetical protein
MNLAVVALNCTGDEYLHNISWANIIDLENKVDVFKFTDTLANTLKNLRNRYDYALIVREGTYLREELVLDFIQDAIKDGPDIIAFKDMNSFCFVVRLNHDWYVSGSDTFVQDVPVNTTIKYFNKEVQTDTFVKTDSDWKSEHDYNLDLDRIYLENTEPLYKECSDEEYNAFYTYDKTIYLLCAGNKPFIALTEYYRNQVTPQAVIFYDISKTSIEYYKEIFTSKELLLNQLPDSIDKQDFFDWFKSFNIDFVNKDILEDYTWIRSGSSIWRSNIFTYKPTRIKHGVETVDEKRRQFEKYCKDNDILVWKFLPKK